MANLTSFLSNPSLQTKNKEIPIKTYNVDHTGPNNQFGGDHTGLARAAYHVVISGKVAADPIAPEKNTTKIDNNNLGISFIFKLSIFFSPFFNFN